jgi:hypothetical protein
LHDQFDHGFVDFHQGEASWYFADIQIDVIRLTFNDPSLVKDTVRIKDLDDHAGYQGSADGDMVIGRVRINGKRLLER